VAFYIAPKIQPFIALPQLHQKGRQTIKWRKGPIPAKGLTGRGKAKGKGPIQKGYACMIL